MAFVAPLALAATAIGAVVGGVAQYNAGNYAAQVAKNNAVIANQNAEHAIAAGEVAAEAKSRKGAAVIGAIKARQAASGIDVNTGSAVDVQAGQRETEKLDTETVLSNSELSAYGYRTQATGFEAQAGLDTMRGEAGLAGGVLSAGGTLLGGASSLGAGWGGGGAGSGDAAGGSAEA